MSNDKELDEAYKKLENISGDKKLRRLSELRLKAILDEKATLECGREAGLKEGIAKRKRRRKNRADQQSGKTEEKNEIAKTLIAKGFEKNEIAEITELSIEEIEKLEKEQEEG